MGIAAGLNLAFPSLVFAVDVNAASQAQLEAVRGIGPKTAQIIIQERSRGGEYESFQDLSERVKGIGPKKAASLQASGLTLSAPKSGTAGKVATSPQSPRADKGRP
jgi:competence protein ComEA